MAERFETGAGTSKISCFNRDCLAQTNDVVDQEIERIICKNVCWTEEEKERCKTRFKEIFKEAVDKNISLGESHTSNQEDGLGSLQAELLPKLDKVLIETAKKRKIYPKNCRELLEEQLDGEYKRIEKQRYEVGSEVTTQGNTNVKELSSSTSKRLKTTATELSRLSKAIPGHVERADNLQHVLLTNSASGSSCKTDEVIFGLAQGEKELREMPNSMQKTTPMTRLRSKTLQSAQKPGYTLRKSPRKIAVD